MSDNKNVVYLHNQLLKGVQSIGVDGVQYGDINYIIKFKDNNNIEEITKEHYLRLKTEGE